MAVLIDDRQRRFALAHLGAVDGELGGAGVSYVLALHSRERVRGDDGLVGGHDLGLGHVIAHFVVEHGIGPESHLERLLGGIVFGGHGQRVGRAHPAHAVIGVEHFHARRLCGDGHVLARHDEGVRSARARTLGAVGKHLIHADEGFRADGHRHRGACGRGKFVRAKVVIVAALARYRVYGVGIRASARTVPVRIAGSSAASGKDEREREYRRAEHRHKGNVSGYAM